MDKDHIHELLKIFRGFDTSSKWNLDPDEVVQILLAGEEEHLFSNNIEDFLDCKVLTLESIVYERNGCFNDFDYDLVLEAMLLSPHAKKTYEKNHVDLFNATEVKLSDGRVIAINAHLSSRDK